MNITHSISSWRQRFPAIGHYARHELIYLAWAIMDTTLIAAFTVGTMLWIRFWSPLALGLWLCVLILLPFNLSRLMQLVNLPSHRQQRIHGVGIMLAVFFGVRMLLYEGFFLDPRWLKTFVDSLLTQNDFLWWRSIVIALLIVYCWYRGVILTQRTIDINALGLRIRVGALFLAPLAVGLAGNLLSLRVAPFMLIYFLVMLFTIALTRAEEIAQNRFNEGRSMPARWFAVIILVSLGIVITATIFGASMSGNAIEVLRRWLGPLWSALYLAGTTILIAVDYLTTPLQTVFSWLIQILVALFQFLIADRIAAAVEGVDLNIGDNSPIGSLLEQGGELQGAPRLLLPYIRVGPIIFLGVVIAFVLVLVRQAFHWRAVAFKSDGNRIGRNPYQTTSEGGLKGWWQRLIGNQSWRTAASIRRIYIGMCLLAAQSGYPRTETETPYEYLTSLEKVWANSMPQVQLITNAYIRIRYGEVPETKEELDAIREAWKQLQETVIKQ